MQDAELVKALVPAPAGVIPPGRARGGRCGPRPRTRGGHPQAPSGPVGKCPSSPHPRGSSPTGRGPQASVALVPAPAGVILRAGRWGEGPGARPRTRGGHPSTIPHLQTQYGSSPHPRGSSGGSGLTSWTFTLVPAPAGASRAHRAHRHRRALVPAPRGVIRSSRSWATPASTRPRTRGGHPGVISPILRSVASSPHPRGHPAAEAAVLAVGISSPHPRGSSAPRDSYGLDGTLVPAPAGVIPARRAARWPCGPCPRTRGGHPQWCP